MKTALITGASQGIGKELAYVFAQNNTNTILVARNKQKLDEIASDLKTKFKVNSFVIVSDLSVPGEDKKLYEKVKELNISIDFLINNAGFGDLGQIRSEKLERYTELLNLNIVSLSRLTALFIDEMKQKDEAYIMNVSSTAGFHPIPYFGIYSASKAFVLSFSEALYFETKDTGLKISVLCPGTTATRFGYAAGFLKDEPVEFEAKGRAMSAKKVAQIAYNQMLKGKMTIITGKKNKFDTFLSKLIPFRKVVPFLLGKNFKKMAIEQNV